MSPLEILRVALASLRATKLRSFLTALGIVIGVAAVITMVALGTGAQRAVEAQLEALGTDLLTISPGQSWWHGVATGERAELTSDDAIALMRDAPSLRAVVPSLGGGGQPIKFGNRNVNMDVVATTPEYQAVLRIAMAHGAFFTPGDDHARRRVAVVGPRVVEELKAEPEKLIGRELIVRGVAFTVLGVLAPGRRGSIR